MYEHDVAPVEAHSCPIGHPVGPGTRHCHACGTPVGVPQAQNGRDQRRLYAGLLVGFVVVVLVHLVLAVLVLG